MTARPLGRYRSTAEHFAFALLGLSLIGSLIFSDEPIIGALRGTIFETVAARLHIGNTIGFNVSVSIFGGLAVWLFVAWVPERRRRLIVRDGLRRRYLSFRRAVALQLIIAANGSGDLELAERLSDAAAFRSYFDADRQDAWYRALDGLQDNPFGVSEISVELELLSAEVRYALGHGAMLDPTIQSFFKRLSETIFRLKASPTYTADEIKYLGRFLWSVMALWDAIDGQLESDPIYQMILRM